MSRYIDAEPFDKMCAFMVLPDERPVDAVFRMIYEAPTADVVESDNVQKTVETYCTDHCYHNAHCMELYKDADDAVEYLERKCEKCPLRELRDLE